MRMRLHAIATNAMTIVNVFVAIVMGTLVFKAWPKPFEWEGGPRSLITARLAVTITCVATTFALTASSPRWISRSLSVISAVANVAMIAFASFPRDVALMTLGAANIGILGWITVRRARGSMSA